MVETADVPRQRLGPVGIVCNIRPGDTVGRPTIGEMHHLFEQRLRDHRKARRQLEAFLVFGDRPPPRVFLLEEEGVRATVGAAAQEWRWHELGIGTDGILARTREPGPPFQNRAPT